MTVLSLVNPAICAAIFSKLETGRSSPAKVSDGFKAAVAILVILVMAALFGAKMLNMFGISLDAFSVAGGFVLAWMGFGMLKGDSPGSGASAQDQPSVQTSLTPLILFAASPGTISGCDYPGRCTFENGPCGDRLGRHCCYNCGHFRVMLLIAFLGGQ